MAQWQLSSLVMPACLAGWQTDEGGHPFRRMAQFRGYRCPVAGGDAGRALSNSEPTGTS